MNLISGEGYAFGVNAQLVGYRHERTGQQTKTGEKTVLVAEVEAESTTGFHEFTIPVNPDCVKAISLGEPIVLFVVSRRLAEEALQEALASGTVTQEELDRAMKEQ